MLCLHLQNATQLPRSFLIEDGKVWLGANAMDSCLVHSAVNGIYSRRVRFRSMSKSLVSWSATHRCTESICFDRLAFMQALTQPVFVKDVARAVESLVRVHYWPWARHNRHLACTRRCFLRSHINHRGVISFISVSLRCRQHSSHISS